MRAYQNLIDGEWVAAKSGRTSHTLNPADTRELGAEYPLTRALAPKTRGRGGKATKRRWVVVTSS